MNLKIGIWVRIKIANNSSMYWEYNGRPGIIIDTPSSFRNRYPIYYHVKFMDTDPYMTDAFTEEELIPMEKDEIMVEML